MANPAKIRHVVKCVCKLFSYFSFNQKTISPFSRYLTPEEITLLALLSRHVIPAKAGIQAQECKGLDSRRSLPST